MESGANADAVWGYSVPTRVTACTAQNDRPLVSRLANIGMPADSATARRRMLRSPNQPSRHGDRKSCGRAPLARPSGARVPISGISEPRFIRLAEFRLLGLLVLVIASSKL
jgi:hypothetical protein